MASTVAEIAAITDAKVSGLDLGTVLTGHVEFDSRRIKTGDLFLAIAGENADGAAFAAQAVESGAIAVITTHAELAGRHGEALPLITVADPIAAITALAAANARRLPATIIGITGSSGKTSTKDLLAQVLSEHGPTVSPPGSFNNELGHPYTVLLADEQTRYLVLEKSARGLGHIKHLTDIAPPRIGCVLNVGSAHVGEFGSVEAIAQAKGELVEALAPAADGGVAVLNADDPLVMAMAARTQARIVSFGEHEDATVRARNVTLDELARASFDLEFEGKTSKVTLSLHGEHHISNALAVAAMALVLDLDLKMVAGALSRATARSLGRMQVSKTVSGITVINDAYNANPESMRAALKALAIMSRGRRSVAVLGHMAELGASTAAEHDALGRLIVRFDISKLIAVGEVAKPISHAAALEGSWNGESEWVGDVSAAIRRLQEYLLPGDVVLIKGSRSAGMERVAEAILAVGTIGVPG